jgi:hypothetical protein
MRPFFILLTFCSVLLISIVRAEIYTYVDENGKTQFTNIPPSTNNKVITIPDKAKETENSSEPAEERLQKKKEDIEKKYKERQEASKKDSLLAHKRQKEQDQIDQADKAKKEQIKSKVRAERDFVMQKKKRWLAYCDDLKNGYVVSSDCRDMVKENFTKVVAMLDSSPTYYFENKSRIDRDNEGEIKSWCRVHKCRSH